MFTKINRIYQFLARHAKSLEVLTPILTILFQVEWTKTQQFLDTSEYWGHKENLWPKFGEMGKYRESHFTWSRSFAGWATGKNNFNWLMVGNWTWTSLREKNFWGPSLREVPIFPWGSMRTPLGSHCKEKSSLILLLGGG